MRITALKYRGGYRKSASFGGKEEDKGQALAFGSIIIDMKLYYQPQTRPGLWSVRLFAASVLFFILFFILIVSGQRGGDTFFSNPALAIPMLVAAILAVGAFLSGALGIDHDGERALFVFVATLIGFLVLLYGLAEIIFTH